MKKIALCLLIPFIVNCSGGNVSNTNPVQTNIESEDVNFILSNSLTLINGEKISLSNIYAIPNNIDSIQVDKVQFEATLSDYCGKGNYIYDEEKMDGFLSKKLEFILYYQYKKNNTEPTAFNFKQDNVNIYLTVVNHEIITKYCRKRNIRTRNTAFLLKVYSNGARYNLLAINDVKTIE
ncbi:hypothetical protein Ga0061079_102147 [Apibacter mensalis]|jgi:hypothetical protein|uniref:Lipoprotein n=1 Tax=Apibacter mensalis TaxID=1586267 RepID=A0A0X3AMI7_9FLAO|nr:hypothetical protein [Apibacter mensalis]CVK15600.1 hypothetical protein Ga0061079_102147 [Apibacter mensalis]